MQGPRTIRTRTTSDKERTFRAGPYLDGLFGTAVDAFLERQICARIKRARKESGFSQEDMAGLLNVTTRAYQNYERNRVPFRRLTEIAKLTRRSEEWILHGDPEEPLDKETIAQLLERVSGLETDVRELLGLVRGIAQGSSGHGQA